MGFNQTLLVKGGSASKFTDLTDTFPNYTGKAGQVIVVNPGETGLTSQVLPSGTSLPQLSDGIPVGRPALASLAWINQGLATASEYANGPIIITSTSGAGDNLRCLVQGVPVAPYALTVKITPLIWNLNYILGGICLIDSAGKLLVAHIMGGGGTLQVERWNSVTSLNIGMFTTTISPKQSYWFRAINDGVNLKFYLSNDGVEWISIYSEAINAFLGAISYAGVHLDFNNSGGYIGKLSIWSFMLESGSGTNSHW